MNDKLTETHKLKMKLTKITNGYINTMKELVSTLATLIIFFNIVQTEMGVDFKTDIEKYEKLMDKYKNKLCHHGVSMKEIDHINCPRQSKVIMTYEEQKARHREYKRRQNKTEEQK